MSSTIKEHQYNNVYQKNQANTQTTVNKVDKGHLLRRADVEGSGERSVSTEPRTLQEFFELFQKVLTTANEYDKVNYDLKLTNEYPTDPSVDTELPAISVLLLGRTPAYKEVEPRLIRVVNDPENAGNMLEIYAQRQSNRIAFDIWTRTNKDGNILAEWIEEKFFEYLWVFKWGGFQNIVFLGRDQDETEMIKGSQLIHKRRLRFELLTSRITKRSVAQMRKIRIDFGIDFPDASSDLLDR